MAFATDTLYLSCGTYTFAVDPKTLILPQLPDRFHDFISPIESHVFAHMHFCELSIEDVDDETEHWLFESFSDYERLTYFLEKRARFSVGYHDAECMVAIPELNRRNVMLGLQHAILLALAERCIGFHGVTLICGDRVVILSAPSGTGKTTLATLLRSYCDAAIINGDFALLSPTDEGVVFEPTPFCGTSGIAHQYRLKVDRIVFLEQAKENQMYDLDARQALKEFLGNTFLPNGDHQRIAQIEASIFRIIESVKVSRFSFAPTQEAADLFQCIVTK